MCKCTHMSSEYFNVVRLSGSDLFPTNVCVTMKMYALRTCLYLQKRWIARCHCDVCVCVCAKHIANNSLAFHATNNNNEMRESLSQCSSCAHLKRVSTVSEYNQCIGRTRLLPQFESKKSKIPLYKIEQKLLRKRVHLKVLFPSITLLFTLIQHIQMRVAKFARH